jgi:hypothetical protein
MEKGWSLFDFCERLETFCPDYPSKKKGGVPKKRFEMKPVRFRQLKQLEGSTFDGAYQSRTEFLTNYLRILFWIRMVGGQICRTS